MHWEWRSMKQETLHFLGIQNHDSFVYSVCSFVYSFIFIFARKKKCRHSYLGKPSNVSLLHHHLCPSLLTQANVLTASNKAGRILVSDAPAMYRKASVHSARTLHQGKRVLTHVISRINLIHGIDQSNTCHQCIYTIRRSDPLK